MMGAKRTRELNLHRMLAGLFLGGGAAVLILAMLDGHAEPERTFELQIALFSRYVAAGALLYLGFELVRLNLRGILLGVLLLLFSLLVHVGHVLIGGAPNWAGLAAHAASYIAALLYVRSGHFQRLLVKQ
jgi:hypothetical protein